MSAPGLSRCLGFVGVLFLTLSAASPASSLFVIVPGMFQAAGTGALWAFGLAGIVGVANAFVYAELASAFPVAGGEYVFAAWTLGPGAGAVVLVVNLLNNMLFPPVVGLGVAEVLRPLRPGLPAVPIALAMMAGSTLVALLNIRVNAWVTGLFLAAEVAALALVAELGWAEPVRPLAPMLAAPVGPTLHPAGVGAIGLATTVAIFALDGYGMAVYFGEELVAARSRIAGVILAAFALTFALELAPAAAVLAGGDPFGAFLAARAGPRIAGWSRARWRWRCSTPRS